MKILLASASYTSQSYTSAVCYNLSKAKIQLSKKLCEYSSWHAF